VREAVFVVEQGVPRELEWDEFDAVSQHVLAQDGEGRPVGTGRLLPDGHLGRMAVLPAWRSAGVGGAMLRHLLAAAQDAGLQEVVLHAQTHAQGFYEKHGFQPDGEAFLEAGIPHVRMRLRLHSTG
jgi:predicted GNAT family N-acyltransferase